MTLKELLEEAINEDGTLTIEGIEAAAKANNVKFADLNEGKYVSKHKYDDDIKAKDTEINGLNETLKSRDTDLTDLQSKLAEAGTDAEKLSALSTNLSTLQTKYDEDTKALQEQLSNQAREFAIREYAGTKQFSSAAARRDYISTMKKSDLIKLDKNGELKGLTDFDEDYSKENQDAFISEEDYGVDDYSPDDSLPMFVNSTQGTYDSNPDPTGGFAESFHFTPVRPMPD